MSAPHVETPGAGEAGQAQGQDTENAPIVAAIGLPRHEHGTAGANPRSEHALQVIDGETLAQTYLARLHAYQAAPDELADLMRALDGARLSGFASAIEKAIRGRNV